MADSEKREKSDSRNWAETVKVLEERIGVTPMANMVISQASVLALCEFAFQRGYRSGRRAAVQAMKEFVRAEQHESKGELSSPRLTTKR